MKRFIPKQIIINPKCRDFKEYFNVRDFASKNNIPLAFSRSVNITGETDKEKYINAKKTLYVTTNNQKKLRTCKPSADYQFELSSSCPGHCEYCYLQTTQGKTPYIRLYINVDEVLGAVNDFINQSDKDIVSFECASVTDPIALEHINPSLKKCIEFFGQNDKGRLRFVTKYSNIDHLLGVNHNNHTKIRFSVNTDYVIDNFEHNTDSLSERINASIKLADAGYRMGFIIAPIMIYEGYKEDYKNLILELSKRFENEEITFELIQHRFTETAKELIESRFEKTKLDMDISKRKLKWGPYGKFKYVYTKEEVEEMKSFFYEIIEKNFSNATIEYFT